MLDMVCSDASGIAEETGFCTGTSVDLTCRDSGLRATLVPDSRDSFQARLTLLDPRQSLESDHCARHMWLRRSLFCSLQPQNVETHMHMDMAGDFASMLQWLMTALPLIPQDLSVLLPRQSKCHVALRVTTSQFGTCS